MHGIEIYWICPIDFNAMHNKLKKYDQNTYSFILSVNFRDSLDLEGNLIGDDENKLTYIASLSLFVKRQATCILIHLCKQSGNKQTRKILRLKKLVVFHYSMYFFTFFKLELCYFQIYECKKSIKVNN